MILLRGTDKVNLSANLPKTFNNPVGFERGLWRRKTGLFLTMPKTSVFGTVPLPKRPFVYRAATNISGTVINRVECRAVNTGVAGSCRSRSYSR
jgi:hypothetical protein